MHASSQHHHHRPHHIIPHQSSVTTIIIIIRSSIGFVIFVISVRKKARETGPIATTAPHQVSPFHYHTPCFFFLFNTQLPPPSLEASVQAHIHIHTDRHTDTTIICIVMDMIDEPKRTKLTTTTTPRTRTLVRAE